MDDDQTHDRDRRRNRAPNGRNETSVWWRRHDEDEKSLSHRRERCKEPSSSAARRISRRRPPRSSFLTDPEKILRWMGTEAQLEPEPGGLYLVNVTGARFARGSFREVVPVHRLAYSFGWDGSEVGLQRGSPRLRTLVKCRFEALALSLRSRISRRLSITSKAHTGEMIVASSAGQTQ